MAILHPELKIIKQQKVSPTAGEWTLLRFLLNSLDNSYEIFYQPFLNGDNPDFAVLKKGSGLLLIEVKDWKLVHYYCDEQSKWRLRKDHTFIKSPFSQVETYKENLFNLHSKELHYKKIVSKNAWGTVSCAVYFHNAHEHEIQRFLRDGKDKNKFHKYFSFLGYFGILGNDSLNSSQLQSLLSQHWLNKKSHYFDDYLYSSIKRYLKPPFHELEEGINIHYSKEQQALIHSKDGARQKIKGVAGSGKTLVLAKRAVNAHIRTENRVLILTYNHSLKNYIHDRISDVKAKFSWQNFYIINYHQFFKAQANHYNLEVNIKSLSEWDNVLFFEKVKHQIDRYDVVLIDEIQDYKQEWIDIITKYFIHSQTEFVVFGDEKQNIYNRELDENNELIVKTIRGKWNKTLNTSHRFASNIGNLAIKFQKTIFKQKYNIDNLNVMSQFDFIQRIVEYHLFEDYSAKQLYTIIYQILEQQQIHSSDVAVLCSKVELLREIDYLVRHDKKEKTTTTFESQEEWESLIQITNSDKYKLNAKVEGLRKIKKNHFWMKTGTIKFSTIHSFKGWEINTLILFIEADKNEGELIYTAMTRAKRNLIIFNLGNTQYDIFFRSEVQNYFFHQKKNFDK